MKAKPDKIDKTNWFSGSKEIILRDGALILGGTEAGGIYTL